MLPQKPSSPSGAGEASASRTPGTYPNREPDKESSGNSKPPVRAINEDDDGYDPYTDWHDQRRSEPLFEEDPWR